MPVAIKTFTVVGRGPFPIDMLRYDSAWPMDTNDASEITKSYVSNFKWEVRLNTADRMAPTRGRWDSFNVRVL